MGNAHTSGIVRAVGVLANCIVVNILFAAIFSSLDTNKNDLLHASERYAEIENDRFIANDDFLCYASLLRTIVKLSAPSIGARTICGFAVAGRQWRRDGREVDKYL